MLDVPWVSSDLESRRLRRGPHSVLVHVRLAELPGRTEKKQDAPVSRQHVVVARAENTGTAVTVYTALLEILEFSPAPTLSFL